MLNTNADKASKDQTTQSGNQIRKLSFKFLKERQLEFVTTITNITD